MAAVKKTKKKRAVANRRHRSKPDAVGVQLGERVRSLRKAKGITFDGLVGGSDLGRGYVSELERGLAVPSLGTLCRLADALDVSVVELVAGIGPNAKRWSGAVSATEALPPEAFPELEESIRSFAATYVTPEDTD